MARTDWTIATAGSAPIEGNPLTSPFPGSPSPARYLTLTYLGVSGSQWRAQRIGVSAADIGCRGFLDTPTSGNGSNGLIARVQSLAPLTGYLLLQFAGSFNLYRVVNDIFTVLASDIFHVAKEEIAILVKGAAIEAWERTPPASFTIFHSVVDPSPITGSGGAGIYSANDATSAHSIDHWEAFNVV
jgi:hypothetical protein